jgi:hypothetical protein
MGGVERLSIVAIRHGARSGASRGTRWLEEEDALVTAGVD